MLQYNFMKPVSTSQTAQKLLKQVEGRATLVRISVLSILLDAESALSHQEIEQKGLQQGFSFDRVTLYRALDWLVEQGIAHKVMGAGNRSWRYNAQANSSQHAHFHCQQCQQVFCLENIQPVLLSNLPAGYQVDTVTLSLQGTCPKCS